VSRDGAPQWGGICPKCTAIGDAHFLTCPTLRAPARVAIPFDDGSGDEEVTP
jgi:hypothetical protein